MKELSEKGVGFKCLQESIDTTTSGGQLIFHIFGALAQFERELIKGVAWKSRQKWPVFKFACNQPSFCIGLV